MLALHFQFDPSFRSRRILHAGWALTVLGVLAPSPAWPSGPSPDGQEEETTERTDIDGDAAVAPSLSKARAPAEAKGVLTAERPAQIVTRRGDVLLGKPSLHHVTVRTTYGDLEIPLSEITRIEFSPTLPAAERRVLQRLLEQTQGGSDPHSLEAIRSESLRIGLPALAFFRTNATSPDEGVRGVIERVRQEIQDGSGQRLLEEDRITTKKFTVTGSVDVDAIDLLGAYGSLRLERADLDRLILGAGGTAACSGPRAHDQVLDGPQRGVSADARLHRIPHAAENLRVQRTSAGELRKALEKHRVLVIPELEREPGLAAQVAAEAAGALRKFVTEGGVVVSLGGGGNAQFLSRSGLLACSSPGGGGEGSVVRRHPIVQGVTGSIPSANATIPIQVTAGKRVTVLVSSGSGALVVLARVGEGAVVYCGWDFFESAESHQKIVANAVKWAAQGLIDGDRLP
jgi:hypothetical protein